MNGMLDARGFIVQSPFSDRRVIVYPAHPNNYYTNRLCKPIAWFWHEPQEPADRRESTPVYFQNPSAGASTTFYHDNDGDLYQMVPVNRPAIANGWTGDKPIPRFNDGGPEFGPFSLNDQSWNGEVEGYTHNIHQTMTNDQWECCVDGAVLFFVMHPHIPRNPQRVANAHADVASNRSDGVWIARKSGIPEEATARMLKLEKDIQDIKGLIWNQALKDNDHDRLLWDQALRQNAFDVRLKSVEGK